MHSRLGAAYLYVYIYLLAMYLFHTLGPYYKTGTKEGPGDSTVNTGMWSLSLQFSAGADVELVCIVYTTASVPGVNILRYFYTGG